MKKMFLVIFLVLSVQPIYSYTVYEYRIDPHIERMEKIRQNRVLWEYIRKEMQSDHLQFSGIEKVRIDIILKELDFDPNDVAITTFKKLSLKEAFVTVLKKEGDYWFLAIDFKWFRTVSDSEVKFAMGREILRNRDFFHSKINNILENITLISTLTAGLSAGIAVTHYFEKVNDLREFTKHEPGLYRDAFHAFTITGNEKKELLDIKKLSWRQYMEEHIGKNFRRVFDISSGVAISSIALIFLKNFLDNKERILDIDVATRYNCAQGGISFYQRLIDENKTYLVRNNYSLGDYLKKLFISKKGNNFLEKGPALTKRIEWLKAL